MSYKRSRATYEADLHAPYATFGTPLPDDRETRDDGSYLPLWKQEVRDERGRKRLHGAFTGGWSAGYFNTVGSKEGWTPSTFVSSRSSRQKDAKTPAQQRRPEDFMDEEDLADAAEAQQLQTSQAFAGLGSSTQENAPSGLMGLFKPSGDTMGLKLLRRMGWKDGQGIGPKVRRSARLDVGSGAAGSGETHLFAPDDADTIRYTRKVDRKGLGFEGESRLGAQGLGQGNTTANRERDDDDDDDDDDFGGASQRTKLSALSKKQPQKGRGGMGVGILNDTGSDDEDPYEIGPKIKYNRVIGGDKKKKAKKATSGANPALKNAPVFLSRASRAGNRLARCRDGRLPLDGFVLAEVVQDLTELLSQYAPPPVPTDWKSSRASAEASGSSTYTSTADAAKASTLDAKSRAAILGEKSLPGQSVFDFLSSAARDRLAAGSGKNDLPAALGQLPKELTMTEEEKQQALWDQAPQLDRETAVAAITRGSAGPYADDEAKKARYRTYLEHFATGFQPLPSRPKGMSNDDFLRELGEFHNCARIFKPMTGFMASRFTTAKTGTTLLPGSNDTEAELLSKPHPKEVDPAEEAAKLGMYGKMTRSVDNFYPTRLLCKRFNVKPPAHSRQDDEAEAAATGAETDKGADRTGAPGDIITGNTKVLSAVKAIDGPSTGTEAAATPVAAAAVPEPKVNPEQNEAVEAKPQHLTDSVRVRVLVPRGTHRTRRQPALSRESQSANLSATQDPVTGRPSVSSDIEKTPSNTPSSASTRTTGSSIRRLDLDDLDVDLDLSRLDAGPEAHHHHHHRRRHHAAELLSREQSPPPPQYPASEASSSRPPPFSSLFAAPPDVVSDAAQSSAPRATKSAATANPSPAVAAALAFAAAATEGEPSGSAVAAPPSAAAPAYESSQPFDADQTARAFRDPVAETKRALPQDTKGASSKYDDAEPPPAYSEGDSPLLAFSYLMAAAGGASSIITQVQQGGPPVNAIGDVGADETIAMDLRGTRFYLSRDELLTLPEFVLLSLFPNGLFPEGQMGGFADGDAVQVDYDPASLQYMLDFFREVAQSIPTESSPSASTDEDGLVGGASRGDDSKRAGIIVLREDLDFYAIPPRPDISADAMLEVKRAAAHALQQQDGIFSGLKRSDEPGTTEAHLIEMLTAGGFNHDDHWGHRAGEPNKAVICSLALARLRSDIRGSDMGTSAVGMAQKLLLFWRKPARRCWWEGVELENVEGVEGKLKVWIRRVWTLEMSVIGLR